MKPISPPEDLTDSEYVAMTLRQVTLMIDPRLGRLPELARHFNWHPSTLTVWITNGRIPEKACRVLLKRFGRKWIDFNRLTGA
jgi:hypothetical protein